MDGVSAQKVTHFLSPPVLQELPSARAQQAQELVVLPDHQQPPATPAKGTSS